MKITAELIQRSPQFTNALNERQLDLRGNKLTLIENMGATLDFFECIDMSDNEIRKFTNFSFLQKLQSLVIANNRISKLTDCSDMLPNLENLCLMTNKLIDLNEVDNLAKLPKLQRLVLINNPIVEMKDYRLYTIYKIPTLRVLDFKKVTAKQKKEAEDMFANILLNEQIKASLNKGIN